MSEETSLLDILRRMLLKFGKRTHVHTLSCSSHSHLLIFILLRPERDESPGVSAVADFDPASPDVYFLVVKWYWTSENLAQQLTEMYPLTGPPFPCHQVSRVTISNVACRRRGMYLTCGCVYVWYESEGG